MQTYRLVVGPDGTLRVPDAQPGQVVIVTVDPAPSASPDREPLTLATAKTPEERAEVIASIEEDLERLQALMRNGPIFTTDDLYGQGRAARMIVDTSALISIAQGEQTSPMYKVRLLASSVTRISAANMLETWMVVDRRGGPEAIAILEDVIAKISLRVEPVTLAQAEIARTAWEQYGKGSGHPAQLNFGDCFAYALAKETGEPLLYVGDDFLHTDLQSALDD